VSRRTQRPSRFAVLDGTARAVPSQVGRKCRAYTARDAALFNGSAEAGCADANWVAGAPRTEGTGARLVLKKKPRLASKGRGLSLTRVRHLQSPASPSPQCCNAALGSTLFGSPVSLYRSKWGVRRSPCASCLSSS